MFGFKTHVNSLIHPSIYPLIHSTTFTDALSLLELPLGTRRAEMSHIVSIFIGSKSQSRVQQTGSSAGIDVIIYDIRF